MKLSVLIPVYNEEKSLELLYSSLRIFDPVRYVLYASCAYYILAAKGIMSFKNKKVQIILIALLCIAATIALKNYYLSDKKNDWKSLNAYILKDIKEDEILI